MTKPKTDLTLPDNWQVLLRMLQGTDQKVDLLLPLRELLEIPDKEGSDLGQALVDALQRISSELTEASQLRDEIRKLLETITVTNTALLREMVDLRTEVRQSRDRADAMATKLDQVHALMFTPEQSHSAHD